LKNRLKLTVCLVLGMAAHITAFAADTLENWLPEQCHYHGEFTQTRTLKVLPQPLQSSGRFLFDCNAGVIWQTASPVSSTLIYTAVNTHFQINGLGESKLLKGIVHNHTATMLLALMAGNTRYLHRDFVAEPDAISDGGSVGTMTLIPKNAAIKRYLAHILLKKTSGTMEISLIRNPEESTLISTSGMTHFKTDSEQLCRELFGQESVACEGLYSPASLADALQTDR